MSNDKWKMTNDLFRRRPLPPPVGNKKRGELNVSPRLLPAPEPAY